MGRVAGSLQAKGDAEALQQKHRENLICSQELGGPSRLVTDPCPGTLEGQSVLTGCFDGGKKERCYYFRVSFHKDACLFFYGQLWPHIRENKLRS